MERFATSCARSAHAKRLRIDCEIDPSVEEIVADPARLKQVLYNFLSNALKFHADGGRIVVRAQPEGLHDLRIEVIDNGIGIREKDIDHLFVEFEQLDRGFGKRYPGSGLGLALTRRIVEAQGGHVGVNSTIGVGLARSSRSCRGSLEPWWSTTTSRRPSIVGEAPLSPDQILVVDDNPINLKVVQIALTVAGYDVHTAIDAESTLALLGSLQPRLVLMDLQLPGMDGLALTRRLKSDPKTRDAIIVAVTAYAMKGDEQRALEAGCDGYMTKPINTRTLAATVAGYLAGTR